MATGRERSGGTTRVRVVGAVVAVVVAVVGVAATLVVVTGDDPAGPRVLVAGDSVTSMATPELQDSFAEVDDLELIGLSGRRTDEILAAVRPAFADEPPDVAVFVPGYNDLLQEVDAAAAVTELMDLADDAPCAVWVLLPTKGDWDPAQVVAYNDRVELLATDRAGVHVETGWRDAVDDTDGSRPDPELVLPDDVHPTPAGRARLAKVAAAAVDRRCG